MNIDKSYKSFLEKLQFLLDISTPQEISKSKLKFKDNPQITFILQNSRFLKNHYLSNFKRLIFPGKKDKSHIRWKPIIFQPKIKDLKIPGKE